MLSVDAAPEAVVDPVVSWLTPVLAKRLRAPGCRVLDLSCGTGAVGMALAAALPSVRVTLTDLPSQTDAIADNVKASPARDRVHVTPLPWGSTDFTEPFELVVCCDAVYSAVASRATAALVSTVIRLATMCPVVLVWEQRSIDDEAAFIDSLRAASCVLAVEEALGALIVFLVFHRYQVARCCCPCRCQGLAASCWLELLMEMP